MSDFRFAIPSHHTLLALCATLALVGCGGSEVSEQAQEESYAEVKVMVEDFAKLHAEDKARAQEEFPGMYETIAGYAENAIGEHNETMNEMYEQASKIEANFDDADAVAKLNELAQTLPGDAAAFRQEMEANRN